VKQDHTMTHWLFKNGFVMQPLHKPPLCSNTVAASPQFAIVTWHGNYEVLHSFICTTEVQSMLRIRDGDRAMLVQHSNLALSINFYHYLWVTNHFMQLFHTCTVNIQVQMCSTCVLLPENLRTCFEPSV